MAIDANEQIEKFREFIETNYQKQLNTAIRTGRKFLLINFQDLAKFDPGLSEEILEEPEETLKAAELSLEQLNISEDVHIRIRFNNLPKSQEMMIRDIRSMNIGKFLFLLGIVRQSSDVRPQVVSAKFECPACGNTLSILQLDTKFKEPTRCSCGRRGHFRLLSKDLVDAQRLVIEEAPESLTGGEQPKRISIFLKEDLVEPKMEKKTTPGSKVKITGIVKEVPIILKTGVQSIRYDLMMEANYIEPIEESYEEIEISEKDKEEIMKLSKDPNVFERLVKSIAPSIYGHEDIKEALILQLMGGVRKEKRDGTVIRGDMHILLVGDPGASKSTLLMYMSKAAPKARYISGKGASGAGLCVSKDSLVITNPGEIHQIKEIVETNLRKGEEEYAPGIFKSKIKTKEKTFSLNDEGKIETNLIDSYWKIKSPETLIRIKTQSGKEIITTGNTKIFTLNQTKIECKKASSFRLGDYLATARKIPEVKKRKEVYTLELVDLNPTVYLVKNNVKEMIKILLKKYKTIRNLARKLKVNENNLYHNWVNKTARGNINLNTLRRLMSEAGYTINKLKRFELSLYKGHRIKLPYKINKELFYFAGLIAGDGDLSQGRKTTTIRFSNNNKKLLNYFKNLSKKLFNANVNVSSEKSEKRSKSLRFSSKLIAELMHKLGIPKSPKSNSINPSNIIMQMPNLYIAEFLKGLFDCDGSVIQRKTKGANYIDFTTTSKELARKIQLLLLRFEISSKLRSRKAGQNKRIKSKYTKYIIEIKGKENLIKFRKRINFNDDSKKLKLNKIIEKIDSANTNIDIIPNIQDKIIYLIKRYRLKSRKIFGYKKSLNTLLKSQLSHNYLLKIIKKLGKFIKKDAVLNQLKKLAYSDLFWEKIIEKETIRNKEDYVYDFTVKKHHNFLVNGIVVHNTASVVKDEFLRGWALEAGALVLANGGLACIDELDKMSPEDRSAMHEALEQQRVTISKANIQATLKAETTVLAAANPKLGRFDPYSPIAGQIELPPTLINRFDLIFPIRDIPSRDMDEKIASHVLSLQQNPDLIEPEIPIDLFKKYIAYAKQNIKPKLTDPALEEIKTFYINLRNTTNTISGGEETLKPIPISARQLEALVRLAEGSARVRLSKTVTRRDAQRAINLLRSCLMQVGFDYETGQIDIDRISTGIPTSERSKIITVRNIINEMHAKGRKTIPIEDIISEASAKDISEADVEEIIERLKREGSVFEPTRGKISIV